MDLIAQNDSSSSPIFIYEQGIEEKEDLELIEACEIENSQGKKAKNFPKMNLVNQNQLPGANQLLPTCSFDCKYKISEEDQNRISKSYHCAGTPDSQFKFIDDFTQITMRTSSCSSHHRKTSKKLYTFFLETYRGRQEFCASCFCLILKESPCRIKMMLDQKWDKMKAGFRDGTLQKIINLTDDKEIEETKKLKTFEPLSVCLYDCMNRIPEDDQKRTFEFYNQNKDIEFRFKFISELTTLKRRYYLYKKSIPLYKPYFPFFFLDTNQGQKKACIACFHSVLEEDRETVTALLDRKWKEMKEDEKTIAITLDKETEIETHINTFALCRSLHFSDHDFGKYLPIGLNVEIMYQLYINEVFDPVDITFYREVFDRSKLEFASSFLGKCIMCETARQGLKISKSFGEKSKYHTVLTDHMSASLETELSQKEDFKRCSETLSVCSFGFQPSLPTFPYKSRANYRLPSWTYNFTVTKNSNLGLPEAIKMYMWHESLGGRNVNEIASCLYQFLGDLPPEIKTVVFYSSSCNRKCRSKVLSMMFLQALSQHETLDTIEHKFLFDGHSYNEKILEKNLKIMEKYSGKIEKPQDWYSTFINETAKSSVKSEIVVMTQDKINDFNRLWTEIYEECESFLDEDIKCLRYAKGRVYCRRGWKGEYEMMTLSLKRESRFENLLIKDFSKLRKVPRKEKTKTYERKKENAILNPMENQSKKSVEICNTDSEEVVPVDCQRLSCPGSSGFRIRVRDINELGNGEFSRNTDNLINLDDENDGTGIIEVDDKKPFEEAIEKFIKISDIETDTSSPIRDFITDLENANCNRASKCHLKIAAEDQKEIYNSYWRKSHEERFSFLHDLIDVQLDLRNGGRLLKLEMKDVFVQFFLDTARGRQTVCRNCFTCFFGEEFRVIENVLETKSQAILGSIPSTDSKTFNAPMGQVGVKNEVGENSGGVDQTTEEQDTKSVVCIDLAEDKHRKVPSSRVTKDDVSYQMKEISAHADYFLKSRVNDEDSLKKVTIHAMFEDYKDSTLMRTRIGHYQNLLAQTDFKFKLPFLTGCRICADFGEQFGLEKRRKIRANLDRRLTNHLDNCQLALEDKLEAEELARESQTTVVSTFGFQPSFPVPFQNGSKYIFNLTIQQESNNPLLRKSKSFVWSQAEGKRTANEIASCLYEYLKSLPNDVESVIFYSSSCSGESRGKALAMMFTYFLANCRSRILIQHRFLDSGHFREKKYLDSQWVENIMRDHDDKIRNSQDWYSTFQEAAKSNEKSDFVFMTSNMFYDFNRLWEKLQDYDSVKKEPYLDEHVRWLRYMDRGFVHFKPNLKEKIPFQFFYMTRKGKPFYPFGESLKNVKLCVIGNDLEIKVQRKEDEEGSFEEEKKDHLDFVYTECSIIKEEIDLSVENSIQEDPLMQEVDEPPLKISRRSL